MQNLLAIRGDAGQLGLVGAGITALMGRAPAMKTSALRTERRKPSAACHGNLVALHADQHSGQNGHAFIRRCGKDNLLDHLFEIGHVQLDGLFDRSGTGRGGNSWASIHLISVLEAPQRTFRVWVRTLMCRWR